MVSVSIKIYEKAKCLQKLLYQKGLFVIICDLSSCSHIAFQSVSSNYKINCKENQKQKEEMEIKKKSFHLMATDIDKIKTKCMELENSKSTEQQN